MACLDDNRMLALLEGQLDTSEAASAEAHLDQCADCMRLFVEIGRSLGHEDLPERTRVGVGSRIDRYLLTRAVGAGAMGIVFEALDERLHRSVALKFVRPIGDESSRTTITRRVLREARAMARLSHPNVVAVYDVGVHADGVFVTMELVDGSTLTRATSGKSTREILDLYAQAGEGLAAAHAAGLVHRDFKPDNVLVSRDGRAKVGDFGLARPESDPSLLGQSVADTLRQGTVGTPAYMSPEQLRGRSVDARADVFAFSVALYEALYGARPFRGGETLADILEAMDTPIAPPKSASVPSHVTRALIRGLATDRDKRTSSMRALLDELGRDGSLRTRVVAICAVVAAIGCALIFWSQHETPTVTLPSPRVEPSPIVPPIVPSVALPPETPLPTASHRVFARAPASISATSLALPVDAGAKTARDPFDDLR